MKRLKLYFFCNNILPHIPQEIYIPKEKWNEAQRLIKNGIIKKLAAAKQNIDIDTEIAAGIYIYALEEFGKLLLLKELYYLFQFFFSYSS